MFCFTNVAIAVLEIRAEAKLLSASVNASIPSSLSFLHLQRSASYLVFLEDLIPQ